MDDTFQMRNILNNLTEVFSRTDFDFQWTDSDSKFVRQMLPGLHEGYEAIYLVVSSDQLEEVRATFVYRIDPDLKVTVYNTHKLRNDSYAIVREFKYRDPKSFLEDAYSAQRSLVNLPA